MINQKTSKKTEILVRRALAVILAGVFLSTNTLSWAKEERLFFTAIEDTAFSSRPANNIKLSPALRTGSDEFKGLYKAAAICKFIEKAKDLTDIKDILAKIGDVESITNAAHLSVKSPAEVIIEIPSEGVAVRYFDPAPEGLDPKDPRYPETITPYSDVLKLRTTEIVHGRLIRQIIHRTKALPAQNKAKDASQSAASRDQNLLNLQAESNSYLELLKGCEDIPARPGVRYFEFLTEYTEGLTAVRTKPPRVLTVYEIGACGTIFIDNIKSDERIITSAILSCVGVAFRAETTTGNLCGMAHIRHGTIGPPSTSAHKDEIVKDFIRGRDSFIKLLSQRKDIKRLEVVLSYGIEQSEKRKLKEVKKLKRAIKKAFPFASIIDGGEDSAGQTSIFISSQGWVIGGIPHDTEIRASGVWSVCQRFTPDKASDASKRDTQQAGPARKSASGDESCIILDNDGVILNTTEILTHAAVVTFCKIFMGIPSEEKDAVFDDKTLKVGLEFYNLWSDQNTDKNIIKAIEEAKEKYGVQIQGDEAELAERYNEDYKARRDAEIENILRKDPDKLLLPGAREFIIQKHEEGKRLFITSSATAKEGRLKILRATGIAQYFEEIHIVPSLEEKMEAIAEIIAKIGVGLEDILYIDDVPKVVAGVRKRFGEALHIIGMPATPADKEKMLALSVKGCINNLGDLIKRKEAIEKPRRVREPASGADDSGSHIGIGRDVPQNNLTKSHRAVSEIIDLINDPMVSQKIATDIENGGLIRPCDELVIESVESNEIKGKEKPYIRRARIVFKVGRGETEITSSQIAADTEEKIIIIKVKSSDELIDLKNLVVPYKGKKWKLSDLLVIAPVSIAINPHNFDKTGGFYPAESMTYVYREQNGTITALIPPLHIVIEVDSEGNLKKQGVRRLSPDLPISNINRSLVLDYHMHTHVGPVSFSAPDLMRSIVITMQSFISRESIPRAIAVFNLNKEGCIAIPKEKIDWTPYIWAEDKIKELSEKKESTAKDRVMLEKLRKLEIYIRRTQLALHKIFELAEKEKLTREDEAIIEKIVKQMFYVRRIKLTEKGWRVDKAPAKKKRPTSKGSAQNNSNLFSSLLTDSSNPALLRVPIEAIESIDADNISDFLNTLQRYPDGVPTNCYVELYYMSGTEEVAESVYRRYGVEKKDLPKILKDPKKRTRKNTITLFAALKGKEMDRETIKSNLERFDMTPKNTVLSPIGLQHDPAGLIRSTILGLKIMDIAKRLDVKGVDMGEIRDSINADILHQLRNVCDAEDFNNFNLNEDDIIALAAGNINNIFTALNKLIKLLPITPIDAEELRHIYEHAKAVITAA